LTHCIDTSSLIEAWRRAYPPDTFPGLWARIEEAIENGDLIASAEVLRELEEVDDGLAKWARDHRSMFIPLDDQVQEIAERLINEYEGFVDVALGRSDADPFVIATAIARGAMVVTQERLVGAGGRPKIPNVCETEDVACGNLLDMLRSLGWTF
jgi:hypothetical protein